MAAPTAFWDKVADGYAKMPIADEAAYEKKLAKTREYLTPDTQLLEFACGTGGTAIKHAPFVKHIDAIDISAKMIDYCEEKRQSAKVDNVNFRQDTIESLNAENGQYDVVMGMSILHLLEDKDAVIRKVYNLLKPGGVFISSTICLGDSMPFFKLIAPIGKLFGKMPLVRSLKVDALQTSMLEAGFEVDYRWQPTPKSAVFLIVRKPG
jgi:2-polyprenyl-3-methyl-5-hydroxy-6-metoxy-1,4-benzoquinol methylase